MDEPSMNWIRLIELGEGRRGTGRARIALAVTPPEWAHGLASLIKASGQYRDVGLLVTNVGPRSQAAHAGIARSDVLLRYNGVPLESAEQLRNLEGVPAQGETHRLEAVRGEREMTFTVTGGHLGITVSAFLHRLGSSRRVTRQALRASRDNQPAAAGTPALVDVPDELVPQVSQLAEVLQRPVNAKQRKRAEALLLTAAGVG